MVAAQGHQMEKRYQRGKSSTAYENDPTKEKTDVQNAMGHEKRTEESSRSVAQHAGRNGWTVCSVKDR